MYRNEAGGYGGAGGAALGAILGSLFKNSQGEGQTQEGLALGAGLGQALAQIFAQDKKINVPPATFTPGSKENPGWVGVTSTIQNMPSRWAAQQYNLGEADQGISLPDIMGPLQEVQRGKKNDETTERLMQLFQNAYGNDLKAGSTPRAEKGSEETGLKFDPADFWTWLGQLFTAAPKTDFHSDAQGK